MELRGTRREFLMAAGSAGASYLLAGCAGRNSLQIDARMEGPSIDRGHLLREPVSGPTQGKLEAEILIIGAGIAGLSAAWKLRKSGFNNYLLLDLEDAAGGTSISGSGSICKYPWGAHYIPIPTREQRTLCELLTEAGIIHDFGSDGRAIPNENYLCRAPAERVFYRGEWHEGLYLRAGARAADVEQFHRFEKQTATLAMQTGGDGRRFFTIPTAYASTDPRARALDSISMAEWLAREKYDSPRLLWFVEYACRDDFGTLLADTSAWAALHYFCSRLPEAESEPAEFLTWPEGNGFLVQYLMQQIGDRVAAGNIVRSLALTADGVRGVATNASTGMAVALHAKRVICATPQFITKKLLPGAAPGRDLFDYSPWLVVNLEMRGRPDSRGFPAAWDNVLYESESLGYVIATHQLDRIETDSIWTWYRPFCNPNTRETRAQMLMMSPQEVVGTVTGDLRRAHPDIEKQIAGAKYYKWAHAMVRPRPGFIFSEERLAAARPMIHKQCGIHFAGTDLGGMALFEEAQWSGVRAAEECMQALGVSFNSSL